MKKYLSIVLFLITMVISVIAMSNAKMVYYNLFYFYEFVSSQDSFPNLILLLCIVVCMVVLNRYLLMKTLFKQGIINWLIASEICYIIFWPTFERYTIFIVMLLHIPIFVEMYYKRKKRVKDE